MRPSTTTNEVFQYVLAVAARRHGIQVHAYCVLSNHFHLVVTDPDARLPAFEQYLDSLVARAMNSVLGRWESFWAPSSYSAVALATPDDIVEKAAYVLANPAVAGLVSSGREWPGLWSAPELVGAASTEVHRPSAFFRARGRMPEAAELRLVVPPGFDSAQEYRELLMAALARREAEAAVDLARAGRRPLGRDAAVGQDPGGRPEVAEPRRGLRPRVAARDKWKRIEALARLATFARAYREAWLAMREGRAGALFPAGTYWLRVTFGVRCAPAG